MHLYQPIFVNYIFLDTKSRKAMKVLLKQILQYKVAANAKNSKCLVVNSMSLPSALAFALLQGLVIAQEVQTMVGKVKKSCLAYC
jgi:hypothetical protein